MLCELVKAGLSKNFSMIFIIINNIIIILHGTIKFCDTNLICGQCSDFLSFSLSLSSSQFVVAGGSVSRMSSFAELIAKELGHPQVTKEELSIAKTDRYAFYKIGPVLSISVSHTVPYYVT